MCKQTACLELAAAKVLTLKWREARVSKLPFPTGPHH